MSVKHSFSSEDSRVHIFDTDKEAFSVAASTISALVRTAIRQNEIANVIIAAGTSITQTLSFLSARNIDWQKVNWYLADERCVTKSDDRRNEKQISDALRSSLGNNFGVVIAPDSRLSPQESAAEYASRISRISMFDFCLLGMGNDGHIASLMPQHPALYSSQFCCEISDSPNPPAERITLTLKILRRVLNRMLVTTGSSKSAAIRDFIANPNAPVRLYDPTQIFADKAAYS